MGRAFVVYGPGEDPKIAEGEVSKYIRQHLSGLPVEILGNPDIKTRDFIHVSDLAAALIVLAERAASGDIVNLGTGQEVSLARLTQVISEVTGRPLETQLRPPILDDEYRLVADVSQLEMLGFRATVGIQKGVHMLAEYLGSAGDV